MRKPSNQAQPAAAPITPITPKVAPEPVPPARTEPPSAWSEIEALKFALEAAESELAGGKELFNKTQGHLLHLQTRVAKLREERHFLANRVMEADLLRRKLELVTAERDGLRKRVDALPWVVSWRFIRRVLSKVTKRTE
jgi:exonuclease VII small subunit